MMWSTLWNAFDPGRLIVKAKNCIVLGMRYIHRLNERRKTPRISRYRTLEEKYVYGGALSAVKGRDGVWRVPERR